MAAKSAMLFKKTVALTTCSSDEPDAAKTALRFSSTCRVCALISLPTMFPVLGSRGDLPRCMNKTIGFDRLHVRTYGLRGIVRADCFSAHLPFLLCGGEPIL